MIAFARVLHHKLPIRSLNQDAFEGDLGVREIMGGQQRLEMVAEFRKRRWLVREADVDRAGDRLHMDGSKAMLR